MTNRPAAGRVGSASWLGPVGGLIDGVDVLNRPPTRRDYRNRNGAAVDWPRR